MAGLKHKKMAITADVKETWKEEKINFHNEISSIEKSMSEYKKERKAEWKSFKIKFKDDMDSLERSLKKLTEHHKK
jgi:hypothetical protein